MTCRPVLAMIHTVLAEDDEGAFVSGWMPLMPTPGRTDRPESVHYDQSLTGACNPHATTHRVDTQEPSSPVRRSRVAVGIVLSVGKG